MAPKGHERKIKAQAVQKEIKSLRARLGAQASSVKQARGWSGRDKRVSSSRYRSYKQERSRLQKLALRLLSEGTLPDAHVDTAIKTKCRLLDLPREIRDLIWRFVVVEKDPLPIQTQRRIRLATSEEIIERRTPMLGDTPFKGRRTTREFRVTPQRPAVALANHQVRWEVLSIFCGENYFVINIATPEDCNTDRWNEIVNSFYRYQFNHVLVEIDVSWELGNTGHGELDFSAQPLQDVRMTLGGRMAHECTCVMSEELSESPSADALIAATSVMNCLVRVLYASKMGSCSPCSRCHKPCRISLRFRG